MSDFRQHAFEFVFVMRENHKIIRISDVVLRFQFVLHILIKLIHVDVHQELRREIAEWETCLGRSDLPKKIRMKTPDDLLNESVDVLVGNV